MANPWQVFAHNGAPIPGVGANRDDLNEGKVKAASHVWFWRKNNGRIEVAIQKRAANKVNWAGYLDVTAAGHVDQGETFLQAAIRESKEEIGYTINPDDLIWLFACHAAVDYYEIDHIYIYEVDLSTTFTFDDGEVESVNWYPLAQFIEMTSSPKEHHMVPQGPHYFAQLVESFERQSGTTPDPELVKN